MHLVYACVWCRREIRVVSETRSLEWIYAFLSGKNQKKICALFLGTEGVVKIQQRHHLKLHPMQLQREQRKQFTGGSKHMYGKNPNTCSLQEDQWQSIDWPAAVRKNPEGEGSSDVE